MKRTDYWSSFLVIATLAAASCAGPSSGARGRLPFHVGVLPVTVTREGDDSESETSITVTLAGQRIRDRIADTLEDRFVRVTPIDDALDDGASDLLDTDSMSEFDLLLQCTVTADKRASTALNEKFWLNIPLFMVGGPLSYLVNDRSYDTRVHIWASLLDPHPVAVGQASLADGRSEYLQVEGRLTRVSLDFVDRAGANLGAYCLSLVVPVGFLARKGRRVEAALADQLAVELGRFVADEISQRQDALYSSGRVHDFFLTSASLVPIEKGARLSGTVRVRRDSPVRLAWCRGSLGGEQVTVALLPVEVNESPRFAEFTFEMDLAGDRTFARLEVASGGRDPRIRSYTVGEP